MKNVLILTFKLKLSSFTQMTHFDYLVRKHFIKLSRVLNVKQSLDPQAEAKVPTAAVKGFYLP